MKDNLTDIPERRVAQRLRASLPVTYEYLGDQRQMGETVTKDLSTSGLRLNADIFFAVRHSVLIKIHFPEVGRIIEGMARVVWSQCLSHSNAYQTGLEFTEISPISKRWIEEYVLIHEAMEG